MGEAVSRSNEGSETVRNNGSEEAALAMSITMDRCSTDDHGHHLAVLRRPNGHHSTLDTSMRQAQQTPDYRGMRTNEAGDSVDGGANGISWDD